MAVPAAHCPWIGPARWLRDQSIASTGTLAVPKGLVAAPKERTLRMDGPRRHILVPSVRASSLLELPRRAPPVVASVPAASHYLWSWSERWSRARPAASARNPSCRKGWIQLREFARSEWDTLTAQEVAAYPWCAECKPLRSSTCPKTRRVDRAQDAQTVSATHNQNAATWKGSNLRPCSSTQHDIPIDGLFSFTLPCAIQNTWYLLAALWLRDQQNHSSHVGTVETLGAGSIDTASEGTRIQTALWAPTMNEKDAISEAVQEQQDWEDSPPPRWPGDVDFQLSPTQPVVRRAKAAPVVQVKSPPTLRSSTEM